MTVAEVITPTDQKHGYSTMCRRDDHAQCATVRAKCTCECHTSARAFIKRDKPPRRATPSRKIATAGSSSPGGGRQKRPEPIFKLVKADPPEPVKKRYTKTIAEQVRPLLEEIMANGDHDWFRCVLFSAPTQAAMNMARLAKAYSKTEWEWRAVKVEEVGQSALYVRWIGNGAKVL